MYLNIQGKHLKITPAINDHVKKKVTRLKNHFKERVLYVHVTLETIKNSHFSECTLSSDNHFFHNRVQSPDMYSSIDTLFDKLEIQVRRYKEHIVDKKRHNTSLNAHFEEIEETQKSQKIEIQDIEIPEKPMSDLEAALQLRVDKKMDVLGYINPNHDQKPSFIDQIDEKSFTIFSYDHFWEKKQAELIFPDKLEIHSVESITPTYDFIENAVDFLLHNESRTRFFISIRLGCVVFLHQTQKNTFEIIREKV